MDLIAAKREPRREPRPRKQKFFDRHDEVIRAAARVFAEKGFRLATLGDVADALDITRAALYYYANSKDDLAALCSDKAAEQFNDAVESARRHQTGREQIVAFFRRYAEIICDDFGRFFVRLNIQELAEPAQVRTRVGQRELHEAVQSMIATGIADGTLRDADRKDISRILFGAFNGIVRWYHPGSRAPGQIADDFLAIFLRGLTA